MSQAKTKSDQSKAIRKYIFDNFEENANAPVLEQVMLKFKLDRSAAFKALLDLESSHHIFLVPGTQRILMAWPFSSVATPFQVKLAREKKRYFANCAWDAVAFHVMLRKEQSIVSYCHHCAEEITIRLKDQKPISPGKIDPLVYLALPAAKWWENILSTCSNNMVFFSSHEHLADWSKSSAATGEALTIEQTLKLSVPFYNKKMSIDYVRPSRNETIALFQSLELTGEFWKI